MKSRSLPFPPPISSLSHMQPLHRLILSEQNFSLLIQDPHTEILQSGLVISFKGESLAQKMCIYTHYPLYILSYNLLFFYL